MTSSWEHTLLGPVAALGERVFAILPNVLAMMILLLVGLGAAWGMGHLTERLLRVIGLDLGILLQGLVVSVVELRHVDDEDLDRRLSLRADGKRGKYRDRDKGFDGILHDGVGEMEKVLD